VSDANTEELVSQECANLRQGDVVALTELWLHGEDGHPERVKTPAGVAILSQTCDVVQPSKERCLVAPVLPNPDSEGWSLARKGRKPLHLYLGSPEANSTPCIADMERAVSVPKAELVGLPRKARYVDAASDDAARRVAWRVGRAFNRFPFPDEVYPVFEKLRRKVQSKSGSPGNLGRVLDIVEALRVYADQWTSPRRMLTLYVVVAESSLIPPDDMDPNWRWEPARVTGLRNGESDTNLTLDRVCELILANKEGDKTTLAHLWRIFGDLIKQTLLQPDGEEVASLEVEVLSDVEMTYQRYMQTESLDLEVLSDSTSTQTR